MECPACKNRIEYSWSVYAKNPLGRFTCAACAARYKLVRPHIYYAVAVIFLVGFVISALGILYFVGYTLDHHRLAVILYVAWMSIASLGWCYFDKRYESSLPTALL